MSEVDRNFVLTRLRRRRRVLSRRLLKLGERYDDENNDRFFVLAARAKRSRRRFDRDLSRFDKSGAKA